MPKRPETLGERIERLRTGRRMSQNDLAVLIFGFSDAKTQRAVWRWETDRARPTPRHVRRLADALGISTEALFEVTPAPPAPTGVVEYAVDRHMNGAETLTIKVTGGAIPPPLRDAIIKILAALAAPGDL